MTKAGRKNRRLGAPVRPPRSSGVSSARPITQSKEKTMQARLTYAIKYVADMGAAVKFHRDTLGLPLKFESPEWSEFATGDVTLALHTASAKNPAGSVELGFGVPDLKKVYAERERLGLKFLSEPKPVHGTLIASFADSEGARCSMSG
jgi:predicted enzyme related to lactoylglutathione lyase